MGLKCRRERASIFQHALPIQAVLSAYFVSQDTET